MAMRTRILEKLTKDRSRDRNAVTVYLSRPLFIEFRELCNENDVSASKVIEELIRVFMERDDKATLDTE
jgi:hypothetical protein